MSRAGPAIAPASTMIATRATQASSAAFDGKGESPLTRILVHHNKVTNPLLNTNDWGGIETWQGGTFYVYNNVGIALRCFALGIFGGLGSAFYLVQNGLSIGAILG